MEILICLLISTVIVISIMFVSQYLEKKRLRKELESKLNYTEQTYTQLNKQITFENEQEYREQLLKHLISVNVNLVEIQIELEKQNKKLKKLESIDFMVFIITLVTLTPIVLSIILRIAGISILDMI